MKSNTRKKILALFAAGTLAVAGVAWAAVVSIPSAPVGTATTIAPNTDGYVLTTPTVTLKGDITLPLYANYNVITAAATNDTMFALESDEILNIQPGVTGAGVKRAVLVAGGNPAANLGFDPAGSVLRVDGGTTNIYAAGENDPDATVYNEYDGGTLLRGGRLNVAHSNAIGLGPVTVAESTTLGTIETSNVDFGGTAPNGVSLNNPEVFTAGATRYHQNVMLRRFDANNVWENVRTATFDVVDVAGVAGKLRIYTGIGQDLQMAGSNKNYNPTVADRDFASMQVVKTGPGTLEVHSQGAGHFGGTHVKEGLLYVDGGTTNFFVGELGATWNYPWWDTTAGFNENNSAKVNYDLFTGTRLAAVWGVVRNANVRMMVDPTNALTASARYSVVPAYMNTWGADGANGVGALAMVRGGGYTNPLTIDAGATAKVNRDQFIGDLNGAGTFEIQHWAKAGVEVIPQVTMQINNTLSTNNGVNAEFSGNIVGKVNLVLDNPVQATGSGLFANQSATRINFFPRVQALTGSNNITTGDTFIKDGTLSINKASNIGPGELRIGMYAAGYKNDSTGVKAGTDNYRGFRDTMNVATFHGLEDMTIDQPTIVYAPGLNVGAAVENGNATDAMVPSAGTRSVTWYGNNPENVSGATVANHAIVGTDGRYNVVGPAVNLAATRGKTVGFSDIKLQAQNGAVPTIAQFGDKNDIRYIMKNAMSINDKMDENPSWDGTVALTASWDLVGATSARMFGFDVKSGTLQLSEVQQGGYALVGLRQGARIYLGNNARNFGSNMQVVIEDDARIAVKPQMTDLAASLAEAQTKDAVFIADSINYTGLGAGNDHMDKRLVVQIDLTNIGNSITDQWIKVVGSHNAVNWNNIHFYSSTSGQTEHLYKVKVAQPNNMVFDGNYSVTPYCDENQYNIYVHIKKIDQPTPGTNFTFDAAGGAVATNAQISGTALLKDNAGAPVASQDVTFYLFHAGVDTSNNANAIENMTSTTDVNGVAAYLFSKGGYGNGASYIVKAVATGYGDGTKQVTTAGAPTPSGSSSSGCDAGFGAFALLAMAGGALVLRKKD